MYEHAHLVIKKSFLSFFLPAPALARSLSLSVNLFPLFCASTARQATRNLQFPIYFIASTELPSRSVRKYFRVFANGNARRFLRSVPLNPWQRCAGAKMADVNEKTKKVNQIIKNRLQGSFFAGECEFNIVRFARFEHPNRAGLESGNKYWRSMTFGGLDLS